MKRQLLTFIIFLIPLLGMSQGADTIVINLNLKYKTIKCLAERTKNSPTEIFFKVFLKWRTTIRSSEPSDNSNVQTDTIHTVVVADMYEFLMGTPILKDALTEFKSSITSKRNTNSYLDSLCTAIEARYLAAEEVLKATGRRLLLGL